MSVVLRVRLPQFMVPRQRVAAPAPVRMDPASTFSATLKDCMEDWVIEEPTPRHISSFVRAASPVSPAGFGAPSVKPASQIAPAAPALTRAWTWLRRRYTMTATKRLRLAETLPLGEKRFVALVTLEGREFLIGGGASGVSLLAQLDSPREPANGLHAGLGVGRHSA